MAALTARLRRGSFHGDTLPQAKFAVNISPSGAA
jgi:hypothetical protein